MRNLALLLEGFALPALFFMAIWLVLPGERSEAVTWSLAAALLVGAAWLLWRSKPHWPAACDRYRFSRKDAVVDAVILALPLLAGWWLTGGDWPPAEPGRIVKSLLVYPFYALLQLAIFLVIPATRLKAIGLSPLPVTLVCAAVFTLAHAPNPPLMWVTGLAMLAWAGQFQRGRSLLALALIMGIAATGFRYAVPPEYHQELRIGPDYIEKKSVERSVSGNGK